ncbi:hypothetical protein [Akkermansia sp.]|uniref:hypothetical protein n=1 Tax=Akkermansia sp. TaxID=1872421 RepID=UPI0025C6C350|nr:hypothetical protein [Akkermansia sp.]
MNTTNILNGVTLASRDEVTEHTENATMHLTQEEREKWNTRETKGVLTATQDGLDTHTENMTVHITEEERTTWNAKADSSELGSKVSIATFTTHKNDSTVHITAQERNKWNATAPSNLATLDGNNTFTGNTIHTGTETFNGSLVVNGNTRKNTLESTDTALLTVRGAKIVSRMQAVYDSFFAFSAQEDYHGGGCWTNASAIPQKGVLTTLVGEGHKDDGTNSQWIHIECPNKSVVHFGASLRFFGCVYDRAVSIWEEAPWALHVPLTDKSAEIGSGHSTCVWTLIGKNYCGNKLPVLIAYNVYVHKPIFAAIFWDRTYFPLHTTWGLHGTPEYDPDYGTDIGVHRHRYKVSLAAYFGTRGEYNSLGYADAYSLGKAYMCGGGQTISAVDGITEKAVIRTYSTRVTAEEAVLEEKILCNMYGLEVVEPYNWKDNFETTYTIEPEGGTITGNVNCDGENRPDHGWCGAVISLAEWVQPSQFSVHKDNSGPIDIIVAPNETGKERWCYVLTGLINRGGSKIIKIMQKASQL